MTFDIERPDAVAEAGRFGTSGSAIGE